MIIEILLALLVLYVCYILGYIFLGFFKVKLNFREEAVYSLGLGIGIIGYLVLILGLFGLLYNYIFWMILIITPVVSVKTGKAFFKKLFSFKLKFHWMLIPIFILLLLNLIGALAPPMGWDTQIYHLPMAQAYSEMHKISYLPLIFTDFPALGDMLITLGILIKNDILSKMIFYFVFLVLVFSIYVFSKKYFGRKIAYLASLLFLSVPLIIYYASTVYTDMILTLFLVLAIFSFLKFRENNEIKWAVLTGVFLGFNMATKITAIISIFAFAIMIFYYILADKNKKKYFIAGIIIFAGIILISEIWFIKSYVNTGNPVYPEAFSLFGGPQNMSYMREYTAFQYSGGGYGRDILHYIISPFQIIANGFKFGSSFSISPLFLIFLPLFLFIKKSKSIRYLLLFAFLYFTLWFIIHPFIVKLIPLLPVLSILTSYAIVKSFEEKKISKLFIIFIVVAILFSIATSAMIYKSQFKVAFGIESREDYLSNNLQIYNTFNYANNNLKPEDKILMIGEAKNYYLNISFEEGDPTRQGIIDYRLIDENELKEWILNKNISYILVNRNYFVNSSNPKPNLYGYTEYSENLINGFIINYTEEVYEKNNVFIYKIK